MAETYCGKTCETCPHREALACPGCKSGPGRAWSGACDLAQCCMNKGHDACESCNFHVTCATYKDREAIPERRIRKQAEEAAQAKRLAENTPFLGKWLWLLFWLVVPGELAGLMSDKTVAGWFPALYLPGQILSVLCVVAYGLILLKLSSKEDHYRTAGTCALVAAAANALALCFSGGHHAETWTLLLSLPAAAVALYGEYHEYMGHSRVLSDADRELSGKWEILWKWYIGLFAALCVSVLVAFLIPVLGLLAALATAIGSFVVSILKLVYLYRTAQVFRAHTSA